MKLTINLFKKGDYILVNGEFYIVRDLKFDFIHKDILWCLKLSTNEFCVININCVRSIDFVYDENFYICNVKKNRLLVDNKKLKKYNQGEVYVKSTSYNI